LRLSSGKLSYFSDIWRACGAFFLLKPKGGEQKAAWAFLLFECCKIYRPRFFAVPGERLERGGPY
jgi:hypothetical protein